MKNFCPIGRHRAEFRSLSAPQIVVFALDRQVLGCEGQLPLVVLETANFVGAAEYFASPNAENNKLMD
jgi:hypothetical protein